MDIDGRTHPELDGPNTTTRLDGQRVVSAAVSVPLRPDLPGLVRVTDLPLHPHIADEAMSGALAAADIIASA